jgi:aspartyl-tRNA(Asn)/glutamyl-tRNA(Gln) amidotransferase subunit C
MIVMAAPVPFLTRREMPESTPDPAGGVISRAEVAHLARLARLAVTDVELDRFAAQLDVILASVARVGEVAADDIEPTSHAVPLTNVFRSDELRPCLTQEQALAAAPASEQGRFQVPRILAEEPLAGSSIGGEEA